MDRIWKVKNKKTPIIVEKVRNKGETTNWMQITRKQQDKIDEEMAPKNELEYD